MRTATQKDSWFQHLTYHKDVQDGASNELLEQREQSDAGIDFAESRQKSSETQWCEPVNETSYDALVVKWLTQKLNMNNKPKREMKKITVLLSMVLLALSMSLTSCVNDWGVIDNPNDSGNTPEKDPNFK